MERRDLFRNFGKYFKEDKKTQEIQILRPPYFEKESDFDSCIKCETKDCKVACDADTSIIEILEDGTPALNFANNGCTYCDDCANACQNDVLKLENKKNINATFSIDLLKCLAWNDTMCFSCKDPCLVNAINFLGLFKPEIDTNICNGCGFCLKTCPSDAISLEIKKG